MCHFPIIVLILPINYILIYIIEHFEIHTPFFLFKKNFLKIKKGLIEEKLGRSYDNIYYTKFSPYFQTSWQQKYAVGWRFTGIWWHRLYPSRSVCETVSLERSTSIFVKPENVADIIIKRPALCTVATTAREFQKARKKKIESRAIRNRGGHPGPSKVKGCWRNEYSNILSMNGTIRNRLYHANYSIICQCFFKLFALEMIYSMYNSHDQMLEIFCSIIMMNVVCR